MTHDEMMSLLANTLADAAGHAGCLPILDCFSPHPGEEVTVSIPNPVVFLPTPHGLLPMKCTPEQYEQFQRDGNKLKIKPIDHGER